MKLFRWLLLSVVLCSAAALGVIETYEFSSPALEARYKALSQNFDALSVKPKYRRF